MHLTEEFLLPVYYKTAFMYGDYSGLSIEDINDIEEFLLHIQVSYDVNRVECVDVFYDKQFHWTNDMSNLGADCCTYVFILE